MGTVEACGAFLRFLWLYGGEGLNLFVSDDMLAVQMDGAAPCLKKGPDWPLALGDG